MPDLTELSEGETALRAVERDWNAAAQHWSSEGLVALYTEDALFYGGRPGHAVGHAKVREYFDSYVGTLAAARLALVDQELRKLGKVSILLRATPRSTLTSLPAAPHALYCARRWF